MLTAISSGVRLWIGDLVGAVADRIFSMPMGDEVPPRRGFIKKNAVYAKLYA